MPVSWIDKGSRVLRMTVSGMLSADDMTAVQNTMLAAIKAYGNVSGLVLLEDFEGWNPDQQWGDLSFQEEHDREIERFAVVGDERWRDEMLAFLVAPFRSTDVRYFESDELARAEAWLAS